MCVAQQINADRHSGCVHLHSRIGIGSTLQGGWPIDRFRRRGFDDPTTGCAPLRRETQTFLVTLGGDEHSVRNIGGGATSGISDVLPPREARDDLGEEPPRAIAAKQRATNKGANAAIR